MVKLVVTLGDERRLRRLDAAVVGMIDGASVFGRVLDDVSMDDGPSGVRLVHVLRRQHRQP